MAEFLTTHATAYNIENIILRSKEKLVLVSPYLQVSRTFMDRLKDADERGTEIQVIYRTDQLKPDERDQLNKLRNLSLLSCENLHAKCYFNEDTMVITSMNMYEFSEKTNREMGVLISRAGDPRMFNDAVAEIRSIVRASVNQEATKPQQQKQTASVIASQNPAPKTNIPRPNGGHKKQEIGILEQLGKAFGLSQKKGYCIRGGETIPLDSDRPFCLDHYKVWDKHKDPDYKEHYCHVCGERHLTSFNKPLCMSCFKKNTS